jgi:hypothetical protein
MVIGTRPATTWNAQRDDLLAKRVKLMEAWARHCGTVGGTVVANPHRARLIRHSVVALDGGSSGRAQAIRTSGFFIVSCDSCGWRPGGL